MQRTTITLPVELKERAMRLARMQGVSFGELVRRLLRDAVGKPADHGEWSALLAEDAVYEGDAPNDLSSRHDDHLYGHDS